jgi:riboflavin kinase / FMN adenylyltransferase
LQVHLELTRPPEFIAGLNAIAPKHFGCVATIGTFDGVHLGHQAIVRSLLEQSKHLSLPSLVIIFEPQPHEYFAKHLAPARIMRLRDKVSTLFSLGIERVLCLRFNEYLRNLPALNFIQDILVTKLGVRHLEIGDDFRFGCDRLGDFKLLQREGQNQGFSVRDSGTLMLNGERISSTRVRRLLEASEFSNAEHLLGTPFYMTGRVIPGKQLGRNLGAATANIAMGRHKSPVQGVFAVNTYIIEDSAQQPWNSVANVGWRPTLGGNQKPILEVHLLDFSENLYGKQLRVEFSHKLRNEQKFNNLTDLKNQIQMDITAARKYFINPAL